MHPGINTPSTLRNNRYLSLTPLRFPPVTDGSSRSSPSTATSTPTLSGLFTASLPSVVIPETSPHASMFSFPEAAPTDQGDMIERFFDMGQFNGDANPNRIYTFTQNLMDISDENVPTVLDLFDPCKPITSPTPSEEPTLPTVLTSTSVSPPDIPYPIKLRLKLTVCSEMKPLSRLAQQIRDEEQLNETSTEDILYCKRVQRLTSQHVEHNQSSVTLHILTENAREPIRLTNISLQSTVAHILYQLLEMMSFDYDQSILKLRSCEEYLRHEDVLCDLEYVYYCIKSLKQLQFVLVRKPHFLAHRKQTNITFEQFCLNQHEKYIQSTPQLKTFQSTRLSNKTKQGTSPDQNRSVFSFDCRRLEEFHQTINRTLECIACSFNRLLDPNSASEQIKPIQELLTYLKVIQLTCSDIPSTLFSNKQRDLKVYKMQIENKQTLSSQQLSTLLCDSLVILRQYIQTYCEAFFIPYEMQIYSEENQPIDIERLASGTSTKPQAIIQSLQPFTVHINSLFSLSSNIKTVRILARLCHGNETKGTQMTKLMSYVRNNSQENSSQVRFNQQLSFKDVLLCELAREALVFFEIYAGLTDENDVSSVCEVLDGIPMRLIGWCSQTLFNAEHHLITNERFLGVIDASRTSRTGFYSLRNISDQDCMILTVSFGKQAFFWPDVQGRGDIHSKNFTEITQEKQEYLSRLLNRPSLLLADHSLITTESTVDHRKQQFSSPSMSDEDREFSEDDRNLLWSHRHYLIHKPYALSKILRCRSVWDYPSLMEIYGLLQETNRERVIDEIEALELLLPAFPDMTVRSLAYGSFVSRITSEDLIIYLPQLLQILKFDYDYSSPIIEYLLRQSINNRRLAHRLYWYLRQLILTESLHLMRYYYILMSLMYVIDESLQAELQLEYDLCVNLRKVGLELKNSKLNRGYFLIEQLKELNEQLFHAGQRSCRLPCQFSFLTNSIDISSCSIFNSLTSPVKLVFNPLDCLGERYYSIYKIGDDLRQDQIVLQLLSCMDQIWQANDFDFRLSIFNVVQTQERCGFIEMVPESETLLEIEKPQGTIKGSFGESALFDWLRSNNPNERDFQIAIENFTYSCAGYCVATYILGIGDRHNENIMVKKSGHLFHIDFGKYLGDTQKFGWFNRDRAPFVFTKQMLYAMSDGGKSNDAMHRFVDLCSPSLNYAQSITHFTELIVDSLNSTWTLLHGLIHKIAQTTLNNSSSLSPTETTWSFTTNIYTIVTDEKIRSVQIVNYEQKRLQPSKHDLYKVQVDRSTTTYHYRTYTEFYEFHERLKKQFPLIGLDLKYSRQTEDRMIVQRRVSEMNNFLGNLFRLTEEVITSDLVCTFFHTIPRDEQINNSKEKSNDDLSPRSLVDSSTANNQSKIRIQLHYDHGTLFIMVRHANNLPLINGNEPKPYCKCYLFPDESKLTKRKGKTAFSRNPILNDTFTYEMDLADIQKRVLRVSVWNNVLSVGNHVLGEVDIVLSQIDWSKENSCDYVLIS